MTQTLVKVGPADHGKRMSLDDFDKAEAEEGHLYELGKGTIIVSDVPKRRHLAQVNELLLQLVVYRAGHRAIVDTIASGSDCKLLLTELESERHPDVAVYKTSSAAHDEATLWVTWIPEIVIEVVSPGSEERDYVDKREEYFRFGVTEYWIVDAAQQSVTVLRRWGGRWRELTIRPPEQHTTRLLPGFALDVAAVFDAAQQIPE